jgi:hypothetical protein
LEEQVFSCLSTLAKYERPTIVKGFFFIFAVLSHYLLHLLQGLKEQELLYLPIVAVLPHGWMHLLQDGLKEQELLYLPIVAVLPHGWMHLLQD